MDIGRSITEGLARRTVTRRGFLGRLALVAGGTVGAVTGLVVPGAGRALATYTCPNGTSTCCVKSNVQTICPCGCPCKADGTCNDTCGKGGSGCCGWTYDTSIYLSGCWTCGSSTTCCDLIYSPNSSRCHCSSDCC